jgi:AcrR family transcriptional regulator
MSPRSKEDFEALRAKSRGAILMAALRLFSQKGYKTTTTDAIARKAGISKGLIYNYFPSKEKILEALIDEFIERVIPALPSPSGWKPPSRYLESLIRGWFSEIRNNPDLIKLGVQFHADDSLRKLIKGKEAEIEAKYLAGFLDVFRRLGSDDPEVETLIFGAILDGVGLNYAAAPDTFPLDRVERHLLHHYCGPKADFR